MSNSKNNSTKKVKVIRSKYGVVFCGKCRGSVCQVRDESKFCYRCGVELDWEEKE